MKESAQRIYQQHEQDRTTKQEEINKLKTQVIKLQSQVEQLQKDLDTIDTGEAMKIMEVHVAGFVLPPDEPVADVAAFAEMLDYVETDKTALATWNRLQKKCGMDWTDTHEKIKSNFIQYRNIVAHGKKFNLTKLRQAMKQGRSRKEKYVNDIMNLFEKVDSLTKFRILASDSVVIKVIKEKYPKNHDELLHKIRKHEICRSVKYLQDIQIEKAKLHLVDYLEITQCEIGILDEVIKEIFYTICPRLGKLVTESEMEVVGQILDDPSTLTFEKMNDSLTKRNEYAVEQWSRLTGGKEWTKNHSEAIKKLKGLLPAEYSKKYDDLPLNIAQLLIPDVLEERLWDAGSDILEIFAKWEEKKKKH